MFKDIYKKSILFEIVDRRNPGWPIEAFTLTIPPQNMEIEENQRISETKTFGGVFIDDYGPDVLKIAISGDTGGTTLRKTYSPSYQSNLNKGREFDGRSAFFYFRDRIMRYKNPKDRESEYQNYDLCIYDLSTVPPDRDLDIVAIESLSEGYVCYLEKFKMTRSKERPLFYSYSIELVAIRAMGSYSERKDAPVSVKNPMTLLERIRRGVRFLRAFFVRIDKILSTLDNVLDLIEQLNNQLKSFITKSGDIIEYPLNLATRLHSLQRLVTEDIELAKQTVVDYIGKIETDYLKSVSTSKDALSASAYLITFSRTPSAYGSMLERISREGSRISVIDETFQDMTEEESEIVNEVLEKRVGSGDVYEIYGYKLVKVDQTTTLDKLSVDNYGSVEFIDLIAVFNALKGDSDLVIGSVIKIPVLVKSREPEDNFIYATERNDVFGKDVRLDGVGKIVASASGDLAVAEGYENLVQAMNLRLREKLGSRLRLTLYGIRDSIGFARGEQTPVSYVISSIKDTVMQDPRVSNIDNIKLKAFEDVLNIGFTIYPVKSNEIIPFYTNVK